MDFYCMQELYKRIQEIHESVSTCIIDKDKIIKK